MFRQDSSEGDFFSDKADLEYKNENNPDASLYSVLGDLDDYFIEYDDGLSYLTFKWVWPDLQSSTNVNFKNWVSMNTRCKMNAYTSTDERLVGDAKRHSLSLLPHLLSLRDRTHGSRL